MVVTARPRSHHARSRALTHPTQAAPGRAFAARSPSPSSRKGLSIVTMAQLYLGMDFGTSGARVTVVDDAGKVVSDHKTGYGQGADQEWAAAWERVLWELLAAVPADVRSQVVSLAIDGTSATAVLLDTASGAVLQPPKLYNEAQGKEAVEAAKAMCPPAHTATASTSTLCKLLTWHQQGAWQKAAAAGQQPRLLHQADWLASLLHGDRSVTDWNNALKLGYDPGEETYPDWLTAQEFSALLPSRVVAPGAAVAPITPTTAQRTGLPPDCLVCGGTTDSIAAFVAAGVSEPGQAVSSLGSTLAIKLLSRTRVDDAAYGIYSHRLGDAWLVGGASNTGGAVLRKFFSDQQLRDLTPRLDPSRPTGLDYYPLVQPGERFPINDPALPPRLEPRPADDALFLQGIFEGIARVEAQAYRLLAQLGADAVREVHTAGGGAVNPQWTQIRANAIGVPVFAAAQGDASYGAALLARQGYRKSSTSSAQTAGAASAR